ncbi:hypothetical protein P168DRAFT_293099 [Aspergillus campestris IBT 28561]|uniref:Large ribosomal subunit protein mL50 n=1 Tax=Aspergillus campestris (strain IBT 28561) TaxID=1392248 RepID=A0A2I1CUJ1_ASPC2|nr:uncharacterized protein P168DRAFT_293099 [Aspergillus campestris IBT 28561]PKY01281.1 hypothetical protein P168DRAFT_293099 [Aspergillus campestris IBT 28561]
MRPSLRLLKLEASSLQGPRSLYVCTVCQHEARPRPLIARQFLRNASSNTTPVTERVRRKIWGTDNPPGLKDPYGGEGVFEKKFRKNQTQQAEGEQAAETAVGAEHEHAGAEEVAADDTYEPATTWEGLTRVGHLGEWSNYGPSEVDTYQSFSLNKRLTKKGQLSLAAHQAAVELCLMQSLGKPLTSVCDVAEHEKPVFKLLWKCKVQPTANGQWGDALVYPNKEAQNALVYIFEQIGGQPQAAAAPVDATEAAEEDAEAVEYEETAEVDGHRLPFFGYQDVKDSGFLSLPLNDPALKFAYLKRLSQLSGHFFPDPVIQSISTVQEAVNHIQAVIQPKPKKLAEHLTGNESLLDLPNVKIFTKRQKPSDKDEELGRKKVIENELRARGLIE